VGTTCTKDSDCCSDYCLTSSGKCECNCLTGSGSPFACVTNSDCCSPGQGNSCTSYADAGCVANKCE
jgi:hypothetical protein